MVALDIETGRRVWHFQFTPHDLHDYDANQTPVLVDARLAGVSRKLLLTANRNGFYYVLDRKTGEFLAARPFSRQSWAREIRADGRPVANPNAVPRETGTLASPGASGATNWWPPSYSPELDLFFIPYLEAPSVFFRQGADKLTRPTGRELWLGSASSLGGNTIQTGVLAVDPRTGNPVWNHKMSPRNSHGIIGGILTTAGGLLFVGDRTDFYALDAATGRTLWSANLGGKINAAPVSYGIDGRQYVVIAAGNSFFAFATPQVKD
jgi:alcohol dehydrogenase (cytochrome c)